MPADHSLELEFTKLKDTKNKTRYEEVVDEGDQPIVGSLYVVLKDAQVLGDRVKVTLTPIS